MLEIIPNSISNTSNILKHKHSTAPLPYPMNETPTNLHGYFRIKNIGGNFFALFLIDDFSRFT